MYPSLFDSFFSPTRVVVVSEERLKAASKFFKEDQLKSLDNRIEVLTEARNKLANELKSLTTSEKCETGVAA